MILLKFKGRKEKVVEKIKNELTDLMSKTTLFF